MNKRKVRQAIWNAQRAICIAQLTEVEHSMVKSTKHELLQAIVNYSKALNGHIEPETVAVRLNGEFLE